MGERVGWSGLPKELLEVIGKILDSRLDVLRSRSVCSSWRSSIPPFHARFSPKFPDPVARSSQRQRQDHQFISAKALSILSNRKAYVLGPNVGWNNPIPWADKVVMFRSSAWTDADEYAVFMVFEPGKLAFGICGDEKWTPVGDQSVEYDDIIVYKGQLYVVDRWGTVFRIECSSLKLVPFSPPLCGLGSQKHLMESCGALYVVDQCLYWDRRRKIRNNWSFPMMFQVFTKTLDFKVYKLDEEGGKWDLLKSLGDRAFVLSTDCCFSVSAQEFVGCKENCIYFNDKYQRRVFSLEDSSFADLVSMDDSHPFWEAPTWLC
ncbi:hypothetical protein FH972_006343 [Carpinus fangiana]|uniref:KIB1-4 beta-propeller domain-containing protein n=1 Tax=Carpinus fangiana TaxID=176857 RepID=A0A5N6QTU9_9ROSI|nr:hypothetical protein FH972_006343 [Carpinus fangiana]